MNDQATSACPHCWAELPSVVDAFCPECRNDLDEAPIGPPPIPVTPLPTQRSVLGEALHIIHMMKLGAVLVAILVVMIIEAIEGTLSLGFAIIGSAVLVVVAEAVRRFFRPAKQSPTITTRADGTPEEATPMIAQTGEFREN